MRDLAYIYTYVGLLVDFKTFEINVWIKRIHLYSLLSIQTEKPPSYKVDKPIIVPDFDEKEASGAKYQILIFKCSLESSTFDLQDYLYHVLWTADGEIIFSSKIVEYSQRHLTNLRTANFDEEGLDKLGILVCCFHFSKHF